MQAKPLFAAPDAAMLPPQPGDFLAFADGPSTGAPIAAREIALGAPPIRAWAMTASREIVRKGSRYNQVLLVRLRPAAVDEAEAPFAGDVAGFSAICTHAGCVVSGWKQGLLVCPCHQSVYDPAAGGSVIAGPAPRPLPLLALTTSAGYLMVATGFAAPVGGGTGRTD